MKLYSDTISPNVSFPLDSRPHLNMRHIDGPLIHFSDCQLHWLTLWQRFLVAIGRHDAESLQRKLRPKLARLLDAARKSALPTHETKEG
jgi:hypothetical protein